MPPLDASAPGIRLTSPPSPSPCHGTTENQLLRTSRPWGWVLGCVRVGCTLPGALRTSSPYPCPNRPRSADSRRGLGLDPFPPSQCPRAGGSASGSAPRDAGTSSPGAPGRITNCFPRLFSSGRFLRRAAGCHAAGGARHVSVCLAHPGKQRAIPETVLLDVPGAWT